MDDVTPQPPPEGRAPPPPTAAQRPSKKAQPQHPPPVRKNGARRPLAMRQASSVGHLASLGRLSLGAASHDALAASSVSTSNAPRRRPAVGETGSAYGGTLVKRSKSLWKFRRSKDDVLAGMALWQHRSLIDVNAAVDAEPKGSDGKGTSPAKGTSPEADDDAATLRDGRNPQTTATASPRRRDADDGLLLQRNGGDVTSDDDDDSATEMAADSDRSSLGSAGEEEEEEDSESCIVVDDHTRQEESLKHRRRRRQQHYDLQQQQQQQLRQAPRGRILTLDENAEPAAPATNLLPRTRLLKARQNGGGAPRQNGGGRRLNNNKASKGSLVNGSSPTSDGAGDGLMQYGRSLQKRLSKPDRGSRFDQQTETTGNRCGPWYDLWGMDASVAH